MKVNAFNVDLESLVWMNFEGFVTFWLPRGFFWYSLFVSAFLVLDRGGFLIFLLVEIFTVTRFLH